MKRNKYSKIVNIILLCIVVAIITFGCTPIKDDEAKKAARDEIEELAEQQDESIHQEGFEGQGEEPSTGEDKNLKGEFLGTKFTAVDFIILSNDEINVYYDLLQDYQMEFAYDLGEALSLSGDTITPLEAKKLDILNEKGYVAIDPEHYYLDIQFAAPQVVMLGETNRYECNDILIDLNERVIYVRLVDEYTGMLSFEEDSLQSILTQVQKAIDSIARDLISEAPTVLE